MKQLHDLDSFGRQMCGKFSHTQIQATGQIKKQKRSKEAAVIESFREFVRELIYQS
jgi:hypothetical protein